MFSKNIIFLAICLVFLPGVLFAGENMDSLYLKGVEYLDGGLLKEAIACFEQVYAQDSGFKDIGQLFIKATKFYGIELYGQGFHAEALTHWRRTLELSPGNEEILAYIDRAENEMKTMGQFTGLEVPEQAAPVEQMPPDIQPNEEISVREVDTVIVKQYKFIPVSPVAPPVSRSGIETGVRLGLAYPTSGNDVHYDRGWAVNIDITPIHLTKNLGLELSGMYSAVDVDSDADSRLSTIGGKIGGAYDFKLPLLPMLKTSAGLGFYNVLHTGEISLVSSQSTTQETVSGYALGLGLDRQMGSSRVGFSVEYLVFDSEFLDNLLTFNIGVGVN